MSKLKYLIIFVLLASLATAFNLDVICPTHQFLPGDRVSCDLRLREPFTGIFTSQFVIETGDAPFTPLEPFLTPVSPVVGDSGGFSPLNTILLTVTATRVEWNLASINFRVNDDAPNDDYRISLDGQTATPEATFDTSTAGVISVRRAGTRTVVDRDNDGITDQQDSCPNIGTPAGEIASNGCLLGDVNRDGQRTVLDIIELIHHITRRQSLDSSDLPAANTDCDAQNNINVLDIIKIINLITDLSVNEITCSS